VREARTGQALRLDERIRGKRLVNGLAEVEFPRFEVKHY